MAEVFYCDQLLLFSFIWFEEMLDALKVASRYVRFHSLWYAHDNILKVVFENVSPYPIAGNQNSQVVITIINKVIE
jgi:hypothetical protein